MKGGDGVEEVKFSEEKIQKVWEKGTIVSGSDPNVWRKDHCGAWIGRKYHGKQDSFGWEIDHIVPESEGGTDDLFNLRPLQWENNRATADSGRLKCVVRSAGQSNVRG